MSVKVTEKDTGWNQIKKMLTEVAKSKSFVRVGIIGSQADTAHGDSGATNGEIGLYMEYGTRHVPARPWLGPAIDKNRPKYEKEMVNGVAKAFAGRDTVEHVLQLIGAQASADVKAYVTQDSHIPPPLAPSTVAAKGSDRPLVDTGQMVGSVNWQVGGGEE